MDIKCNKHIVHPVLNIVFNLGCIEHCQQFIKYLCSLDVNCPPQLHVSNDFSPASGTVSRSCESLGGRDLSGGSESLGMGF